MQAIVRVVLVSEDNRNSDCAIVSKLVELEVEYFESVVVCAQGRR